MVPWVQETMLQVQNARYATGNEPAIYFPSRDEVISNPLGERLNNMGTNSSEQSRLLTDMDRMALWESELGVEEDVQANYLQTEASVVTSIGFGEAMNVSEDLSEKGRLQRKEISSSNADLLPLESSFLRQIL